MQITGYESGSSGREISMIDINAVQAAQSIKPVSDQWYNIIENEINSTDKIFLLQTKEIF